MHGIQSMRLLPSLGSVQSNEECGMEPAPRSIPYTAVENSIFLEVFRGLLLEGGEETQQKLGYTAIINKLNARSGLT